MHPSNPFFAPTGELDLPRVLAEVVPLAKLVAAVAVTAAIPAVLHYVLASVLGAPPVFTALLSLATQFVLAVGTAVVLLYVVARANQLATET